jgi:hypothetical protein
MEKANRIAKQLAQIVRDSLGGHTTDHTFSGPVCILVGQRGVQAIGGRSANSEPNYISSGAEQVTDFAVQVIFQRERASAYSEHTAEALCGQERLLAWELGAMLLATVTSHPRNADEDPNVSTC